MAEESTEFTWITLGARLSSAVSDAHLVEPMASGPGDPEPQPSKCHENAAAYVERHPDCRVTRGWLISGGVFDAHSVVEFGDGRLADPTPLSVRPPFLRHPGSDREFAAILSQNWNQVLFSAPPATGEPLPADEDWPSAHRFF